MMERLLDAVSPELRAWLKDQKPNTTEELGNLANLHVQSRKGRLVAGKFASFGKGQGFKSQKDFRPKRDLTPPETRQRPVPQSKPAPSPTRRNLRSDVTCYKCGKQGHMSFNCSRGLSKPSQGYLRCMTPLESDPCSIEAFCLRMLSRETFNVKNRWYAPAPRVRVHFPPIFEYPNKTMAIFARSPLRITVIFLLFALYNL